MCPALLAPPEGGGLGPAAEGIGPTHFDGKTRAFVRDPNGLLLEFVETGAR
jgi:catechol 2,3-dioxygenase-like lactoylglutathione lyase family enzyme